MSEPKGAHSLLPPLVLRNLGDKSYEKRKQAALEIEHIVKDLNKDSHSKPPADGTKESRQAEVIRAIIATITRDFAHSTQSNQRKGGLIGLAATSIALMEDARYYLDFLLPPVLKCFSDPESRVRYYACEALYNISKVSRGSILTFFNEIFDGLCKLYADPDVDVKNGAALLDRLVKDLVVESAEFDVSKFIPLLRERIRIKNPFIRQLLVGWITVLDSVPDIDMIEFLPEYLGGLFEMLGDPNKDIRQQAYAALTELLRELIHAYTANQTTSPSTTAPSQSQLDLSAMCQILVTQITDTKDNFTRLTLLTWISEFIVIDTTGRLLTYVPDILGIVLSCISDPEKEIRAKSEKTNESLLKLVQTHGAQSVNQSADNQTNGAEPVLNIALLLSKVSIELSNKFVLSRMASLRWINTLMAMFPHQIRPLISQSLFPQLLKTLADQDDAVVRLDLEILARVALGDGDSIKQSNNQPSDKLNSFEMVLSSIMQLFAQDRRFLETRGSLIIRQLCELLDAEAIYRAFAKLLSQMTDQTTNPAINQTNIQIDLSLANISNPYELASLMVQTLNLILLTSSELFELRTRMKKSLHSETGRSLFDCLFDSWSHNPVSTFSLCLLTQAYDLSASVIEKIADIELTVGALMQIDTLIQLIESPIFVHVRLDLLQPLKHPRLIQALYGLLMLMPQSSAFNALNTRLASVAPLSMLASVQQANNPSKLAITSNGDVSESTFDSAALLAHFSQVQAAHLKKRQSLFKSQSLIQSLQQDLKITLGD